MFSKETKQMINALFFKSRQKINLDWQNYIKSAVQTLHFIYADINRNVLTAAGIISVLRSLLDISCSKMN